MLPVVTIIGRPNVGKSSLFNRLTNSKTALVIDVPGTTVDRNYGIGNINDHSYIVIDTAGIQYDNKQNSVIIKQVHTAIKEAQVVLFVVNAQEGLATEDLEIAKLLRKFDKKVILVINKIDKVNPDIAPNDFFCLGFASVVQISAKANKRIAILVNEFITELKVDEASQEFSNINSIKVAIVGQPNVGKSTLVNNILKEERVIVQDKPGTTRDSIYINTCINKQEYTLIDTAGVRRKAKVKDILEKFSVIKTLEAIYDAEVVVLLIDAVKGVVDQDLKLVENVVNAGKSLVIAVNKFDSINKEQQKMLLKSIDKKLEFINFIKPINISALYGRGIKKLFAAILTTFKSSTIKVTTNKLSTLLEQAIAAHQPPVAANHRRIKLRYAHLGGHSPFTVVVHGNQVDKLPESYKKYLSNFFRTNLGLQGTIVKVELKKSENPYINTNN